MDTIITTLAAHGGIGMFCAAFLAGTFLQIGRASCRERV